VKSRPVGFFSLLACLMTICVPVFAHHGSAVSYTIDLNKLITMKGTVTSFEWANPHVYLMYDVKDEKGNVVHWGAETHAPSVLSDEDSWTRNTFKPGDEITITVFPSRVGAPRGLIAKIVLNDKVLIDDAKVRIRTPDAKN
jgi:hypothetical protein